MLRLHHHSLFPVNGNGHPTGRMRRSVKPAAVPCECTQGPLQLTAAKVALGLEPAFPSYLVAIVLRRHAELSLESTRVTDAPVTGDIAGALHYAAINERGADRLVGIAEQLMQIADRNAAMARTR